VIPGRENIRQESQVRDLGHRLVPVGERQQIEVGVGHQHVTGLSSDPAAHVHVAVGRARAGGVDVEADPGLALLAVSAAAAGDVERDRNQVALLDELNVPADLDHLARNLMAKDQAGGRGGPAADHVLVRAANVGRDDLEDYPVLASASFALVGHF